MNKSLHILSISLLLSANVYAAKISPSIQTVINSQEKIQDPDMTPENSIELTNEEEQEKLKENTPIVEPSFWQTWVSDLGQNVVTNIFNEIENDKFDDRAQGNVSRLESAVKKLLTNKQYEKLAQLYFLIKEKNVHFNNELNQEVSEALTQYKEKQDKLLFNDILTKLIDLDNQVKEDIKTIEKVLKSHVTNIQTTAKGIEGVQFQQGVAPKWNDRKKDIIKRKGLKKSLATLKTILTQLDEL